MGFFEAYFKGLFKVFLSEEFLIALKVLFYTFPLWGPPVLAFGLFFIWTNYARAKFLVSQKYVLLEIKLPKEVYKSPLAMELALSNFSINAGEGTWYDRNILGKVRTWFSLEMVSIEGNIHFYIWTRDSFRTVVEASLYGQYPNVEIFEVSDYTKTVPRFDLKQMSIIGQEYKLSKPDPYPIKTYVDFGLDKDQKEEYKIDPLTTIIEYMAGLKKGEQIWLQILVRSHKMKVKSGSMFGETDVQKEGKELIKKLVDELKDKQKDPVTGKEIFGYSRIPTKAEADVIAAIDRSISKINFDCGIRLLYITKPESFMGARITPMINIFKPFSTNNLNSISMRWGPYFDYPWSDYKNIRKNKRLRELLSAYKLRGWFHLPYKRQPFVLSSEELATIFHLPGEVLQAPSVSRVLSKKAEAPFNLPK